MSQETEVQLRGAAEALLASSRISLPLPHEFTPTLLAQTLASRAPVLERHLLREDGSPRASTKILVDGALAEPGAQMLSSAVVTVIPAYPCDG